MPVSRSSSPENDVFAISTDLVPERANKTAGTTSTTFDGLLSQPLMLHEDLTEGCGGQLWPAGMTLSKYMLGYQKSLLDRRIIEIGAGGGLVGLAVASGCETNHTIVITDQIPMLSLMQKNIALNGLESKVSAQVYDWGSPPPSNVLPSSSSSGLTRPDIVLAADCVYFEPAFPLLLQTLSDLIGPETTCYFCFKKRRKADMHFIKDMTKKFTVEIIDYDGKTKDQREGVWLYRVMKRTTEKGHTKAER